MSSQSMAPQMVLIWAALVILPIARSQIPGQAPAEPPVPGTTGDAQPGDPIPADKSELSSWFERNVRKFTPQSVIGSGAPQVITVSQDGTGQFKTITEALNSVPKDNKNRVIISISPGNYTEKIKIEKFQPYITFYGTDPANRPILVFDGNAAKYGTAESGTLIVQSDYFTAVNMKIVNSSPRPVGQLSGAQAVAMRIMGDYASFFNCYFHGFQDTLMDDFGKHLFKDCYIEGTVDFIFGDGQSLYLNCEIFVHPAAGDKQAFITAHSRKTADETTGYVFVHCNVTGTGGHTYLGRTWFDCPRVIFAYCDISDAIIPQGWSNNNHPETDSTSYFGEYQNKGPGAALEQRAAFMKKMADAEIKPFLSLSYVQASEWLQLPSPPPVGPQPK